MFNLHTYADEMAGSRAESAMMQELKKKEMATY